MEILTDNKKIKIHIKNNHGRSGTFPCDLEGEKNFTITKEHVDKALKNKPKIKKQVEFFIDWDEDNFNSSISNLSFSSPKIVIGSFSILFPFSFRW